MSAHAGPLVPDFWPCGGQRLPDNIDLGWNLWKFSADLLIVGRYLALEVVVALQGNLEVEQQFLLPVALQTFLDGLLTGPNARITQLGQLLRITFPTHNGSHDPQPRQTADVTDDVV